MAKASTSESGGPRWSSRFGFLMAAVGAAVGLGNLWRFPFQTGQNGGSVFVIIYLLCVVFIAYPILMGEIAIGRRKRLSAVGSISALAKESGHSVLWGFGGLIAIVASYTVLSTYSVVSGQIIAYSIMSFTGEFANADPSATKSLYSGPAQAVMWHTLFIGTTMFIVAKELKDGIERLVTILMPAFFLLLAGLSVYAMKTGAAAEAVTYLFSPRFDELTPDVVLAAMGQAFYSIAIGTAAMITYGAYLERKENIASNSALIAGADTLVAIVAGLMIFPVVFAFNLDPAAGMGLIFDALPAVFSNMPMGSYIGGGFFLLAFIAALTSAIIMLLVTVVFIEELLGLKRLPTVLILGTIAWITGAASVSFDGIAELIDFAAGSIFLPIAGLFSAIVAGWIAPRDIMRDELHNSSEGVFRFWRFMIRYVAPISVATVLIFGLKAHFGG